jgi:hypothetical protein
VVLERANYRNCEEQAIAYAEEIGEMRLKLAERRREYAWWWDGKKM